MQDLQYRLGYKQFNSKKSMNEMIDELLCVLELHESCKIKKQKHTYYILISANYN